MSIFLCRFCGKWIRVYFYSFFFFSNPLILPLPFRYFLLGEMCGGGGECLVGFSNGAG